MQTDANPTPTTEFFFDELEYIIMTILNIDGLRVEIFLFMYTFLMGLGFILIEINIIMFNVKEAP